MSHEPPPLSLNPFPHPIPTQASVPECIFMILYCLLNVVLTAYVLGTVTMLMVKFDERSKMLRDKKTSLIQFKKMHRVPEVGRGGEEAPRSLRRRFGEGWGRRAEQYAQNRDRGGELNRDRVYPSGKPPASLKSRPPSLPLLFHSACSTQ